MNIKHAGEARQHLWGEKINISGPEVFIRMGKVRKHAGVTVGMGW